MFIPNLWISQGLNWPLKGKIFCPMCLLVVMDWPQRIFCLRPYCVCRVLSLSFLCAEMFFAFSQKRILGKGSLSGQKWTKAKNAATHDLYYPVLFFVINVSLFFEKWRKKWTFQQKNVIPSVLFSFFPALYSSRPKEFKNAKKKLKTPKKVLSYAPHTWTK